MCDNQMDKALTIDTLAKTVIKLFIKRYGSTWQAFIRYDKHYLDMCLNISLQDL